MFATWSFPSWLGYATAALAVFGQNSHAHKTTFGTLRTRGLSKHSSTKVRVFDLVVTWEKGSPDGYERDMFLINGQFPGPLLEIWEGEHVEVKVTNKSPFNITMHNHGVEMKGTPWSDGVPGVSQRHIYSGKSFTYRWKATQYGSYWYHSHVRAQIDDGLYGPITIHPKATTPKPFRFISTKGPEQRDMELATRQSKPIMLSDWQHYSSQDRWRISETAGVELPCFDSILINGKGRVKCFSDAELQRVTTPTQSALLGFAREPSLTRKGCVPASVIANILSQGYPTNISAVPDDVFGNCQSTDTPMTTFQVVKDVGEEKWVSYDIIGAFGLLTMVFSIDEHPMWVYAVDGSYIKPQLVEAIEVTNGDRYSILIKVKKSGKYRIRLASTSAAQSINGISVPYVSDLGVPLNNRVRFFSQKDMKAFPPAPVARKADQTVRLDMVVAGRAYLWAMNHTIWPMSYKQRDYYHYGSHPIHKHSTKMFLIGQGTGSFPYKNVEEAITKIPEQFNLVDPPMRDSFATPPAGPEKTWMVLRYYSNNPGAWPIHCHVETHKVGGMMAIIQDGINNWPTIPYEYLRGNGALLDW